MKKSTKQKRSSLKNYAKMRIAGASSIRKMLKQEKYESVFSSPMRSQIRWACDILDEVLKRW